MKTRKTSKWLRRRHQRSVTAANAFGVRGGNRWEGAPREAKLARRLRRGDSSAH